MTVGSPPSMTATTEFVVPRSMPMILPIVCAPCSLGQSLDVSVVAATATSAGRMTRSRSRYPRRTSSTISPSGRSVPGTFAIASCSRGSKDRPGDASMALTPSLSRSVRSFRSMAAMPSNHGSAATESGRASMARSKSSASVSTFRMRSSPARPRSRIRSSVVRRLKFWNSARSRWSAARYSSPVCTAASRSAANASIWATSAVGETSISSARSCARVLGRSGIEMVHQFIHEAGHEPHRADGLGVGHTRRPEDADDADRAARSPVRGKHERDVAHVDRLVLVADEDLDPAGAGDAADELAEIDPILESAEDAPELLALGELRRLHHVEQAIAVDLLDRIRVVLAHDLDDPLTDALRESLHPVGVVESGQTHLCATRGHVGEALVEEPGDAIERPLVDGVVAVDRHQRLLDGALAEDEDQARHALVDRHEIDPTDMSVTWLGRGGDAGGSSDRRKRRGSKPEPVLAGELDLAELVADHQLLDGGQRDGLGDRFDVEPIALVRGDATGGCVRVGQETVRLELGEDAANRRAGHAEAVAVDERLAADRRRGRDVFLDDGP